MNEVRRRPISSPSCLSKAPNSGLSFRTQVPSSISTYTSMRLLIRCMLFLMVLISPAGCAFINFENCLAPNIIQPGVIDDAHPQILQWVPKAVNAKFNVLSPNTLNITVFGNVTGQAKTGNYPPKDDQRWTNPNVTFGKIEDQDADNHRWSTLFTRFNVLSYTAYQAEPARFCESLQQGQCPIAPDFDLNATNTALPAFTVSHDLYSPYGFTTINAVLRVVSGNKDLSPLACVSADITPYLGSTASNLLAYLPLAVLALVGIATASAAIFSPWGTWNIFHWTSNYGRDADQLRLITPGFGDCIQYIQFVVLSGSLSLNYPGFYRPAVSSVAWSALMFNESFVTPQASGKPAVVDGIYATNGTYGLDIMSQLVGMSSDENIWAGMIIWLLVIIGAVIVLIQLGFFGRWIYRLVSKTQEEDLRAKNIPFTVGNAIRIVFNYFLLPVVALSMYEMVIASKVIAEQTSIAPLVMAILTLVGLILFSGRLLWLIASTRPRSYLFDDFPTVLLYGPLYNTYSDNAAAFALVPVVLTFLRGVAIGAIQPSGIAQLVLLAICEVILILTLNAFRPFSSPTSMNAYHTIFSVIRLVSILLMVAFVPSLGVDHAPRGWIGYVILLMHAITLFVGFFLHSLQTLIEVVARLAGAGGEDGVATRGGLVKVFGVRQLSRRNPKLSGRARARSSMGSEAAMLHPDPEKRHVTNDARPRSLSASSGLLLTRPAISGPGSIGPESVSVPGGAQSNTGSAGPPYTPTTPGGGAPSTFSYVPASSHAGPSASTRGGIINLRSGEPVDPYFRQPRPRRVTMELSSPGARSRGSWASGDWTKVNGPDNGGSSPDPGEGPSISGRVTPQPAHLGSMRDRSDSNPEDSPRPKTDYATREVDYYYGVRGPALSQMQTRRLKTGPADPTGPVSSAAGWFKTFLGGKSKEKGKGFEVVRSSRMPHQENLLNDEDDAIALQDQAPYSDNPEAEKQPRSHPGRPRKLILDDEGGAVGAGTRNLPDGPPSPLSNDGADSAGDGIVSDDEELSDGRNESPRGAPLLPDIDVGGSIHLPSRFNSKASSHPLRTGALEPDPNVPAVPRKSSRRAGSFANSSDTGSRERSRLPVIPSSPNDPRTREATNLSPDWPLTQRLPFGVLDHSPDRNHHRSPSNNSAISAISAVSSQSNQHESQPSGHRQKEPAAPSAFGPPAFREDRPSSMGYVQQHRASDHIHNPDIHVISGSSAELVEG